MIYIITEPRYVSSVTLDDLKSGRSYETEPCIKIGYSSNFETRKIIYTTNTPRFDILYTYDDGTEEDEKRLHQYFSEFRKDDLNGAEWFSLSADIIEFFEVNTTIDQIREVLNEKDIGLEGNARKERRRRLKLAAQLTPLINLIIDLGLEKDIFPLQEVDENRGEAWYEAFDRILGSLMAFRDIDEVFKCLKKLLSETSFNRLSSSYDEYEIKVKGISEVLEKFHTYHTYHGKMEYVCELGKILDKEKFNLFLNSIPKSFKNYYTIFGPATCRAQKYQLGLMEKEHYRQLHNQGVELNDLIYGTFQVGKRYSSKEAKIMLAELYEKAGYLATAKATDLRSWFEMKQALLTEKGTGKRINGFKLLKRLK
jgi:hypothetical protein